MARRAKGEGTIYRHGKYFAAELDYGHGTSKHDRRVQYARTGAEALVLLEQMKRERYKGGAPREKKTVEQYLGEWLEEVIKPTKSRGTYDRYKRQVETYIVPARGMKCGSFSRQPEEAGMN